MSSLDLAEIVQALFAGDRGLLAMDESVETCNKRFAEVRIPSPDSTASSLLSDYPALKRVTGRAGFEAVPYPDA
jgi:hypothetical protein